MQVYRNILEVVSRLAPFEYFLLAVGLAVLGILFGAVVVVLLPADHFVAKATRHRSKVVRIALWVGRNLAGWLLIPVGVFLSLPFVPGTGIVFIVLGLSLADFPGKSRVLRRLLGNPLVRRALNGLRTRMGRAPLKFD